jgi:hypothetical protein
LHEELENCFGRVFEVVCLRLAFNEVAVESCIQDFGVVASDLFMDSKLGRIVFLPNYESDKWVRVSG